MPPRDVAGLAAATAVQRRAGRLWPVGWHPGRLGRALARHQPADEVVAGRACPVHVGRTTHVWDAEVTNATTGTTMALFRGTQLVLHTR